MLIRNDYAIEAQLGYQDPGSEMIQGIYDLHDRIMFYLIIIQIVVQWFFISSQINKNYINVAHGNLIEFIWTLIPAGILWGIGLPSLKLLYMIDEILDSEITIKVIGNQWQFSNAINKSKFFANKNKILDYAAQLKPKTLNPYWVSGFTDAEGSFSINIRLNKKGTRYITSTFKIGQDYKDIYILYDLKNYFNVGDITIHKKEARLEIKGTENAIKYLIPHFNKYPQLSKKQIDYLLWKDIINILHSKQHLTLEGFIECLSLKSLLNKGLNDKLKNIFPLKTIIKPLRSQPDTIDFNWLSGFTAGEGSFMIIIKKNITCITGYQIQATLNIGQQIIDRDQLNHIKSLQGCGNIYEDKENSRIIVTKREEIQNRIVPYQKSYPLMNNKQKSFEIWCEVVEMIKNKEHLSLVGLQKIKFLRIQMRQDYLDLQSGSILTPGYTNEYGQNVN